MFQFGTEQKVCEVGGVKFGGQPGDYPCVCVNSIFQKGDAVLGSTFRVDVGYYGLSSNC